METGAAGHEGDEAGEADVGDLGDVGGAAADGVDGGGREGRVRAAHVRLQPPRFNNNTSFNTAHDEVLTWNSRRMMEMLVWVARFVRISNFNRPRVR